VTLPIASPARTVLAGLGLLAALVPAALLADAVEQSCADCCKLPCIEAEILKAREQREAYRTMSKRKNWKQAEYDAAEQAAANSAESRRVAVLAGLATCNYYVPAGQSYPEAREFQLAGFKLIRDAGGRVIGGDYTAKTNLETCRINDKALELLPKVSPCGGIGRAVVAHERKHLDDCEARDPAKRKLPLDEVAKGEVDGYDVEIAELEKLRGEAAEACFAKSCETAPKDWERAAEKLKTDIYKLTGKTRKKPPTQSPLARDAGGR
jgi:hypothetical protein